jgi:hypothetical protein
MRLAHAILGLVAAGSIVLAAIVSAENGNGQASQCGQSQPPAPGAAPSAAPAPTIPAEHALAQGFNRCLGALDVTTRDLVKSAPYDAMSRWSSDKPDNHVFDTVLAIRKPQSVGLVIVAPTGDGGCDAVSEQIGYFAQSCPVFRDTVLKEWRLLWDGKALIAYRAANGTIDLLVNAGEGCVVIEQQVRYGAAVKNTKR